jgi:NAD-dependent SIR2 family protein deacetylase
VAALQKSNCKADPEGWYEEQFGKAPNYGDLLQDVYKTANSRRNFLKNHFEPNEDDVNQHRKGPMPAHRSIARLVQSGFVKVIITTNFDRLIERALEEIGVVPVVISTPDAAKGAPPILHNNCTVIKVHGDYLDTRIKNTPGELSEYSGEIDKIIDRVLDEFGLIICGWSGEWDTALRAGLLTPA